jgi:hypothetical protein
LLPTVYCDKEGKNKLRKFIDKRRNEMQLEMKEIEELAEKLNLTKEEM